MIIEYKVESKTAKAHLENLSKQLFDLSAAFEKLGGFYRGQVMAQFLGRGFTPGTGAGTWKPLKAGTIREKDTHNPAPLINSGGLMDSFTNRTDPYNINKINRQSARFGSRHPYVKFHQSGTDDNGHVHIPQRPIVLDNPLLDKYAVEIISNHLFMWWK